MMIAARSVVGAGLAIALFAAASSPVRAQQSGFDTREGTIRDIGDVLQYALPAAAFGGTVLKKDWEGTRQYTWAFGSTLATVGIGKITYEKLRPSAKSPTSFPSGHTAAAFSGASFIDARYGHLWGSMAYGLAALTGYSRVWADAHFLDDVVAGASTGTLWSLFYTSPYAADGRVMLMPTRMGDDGYGVTLAVSEKVAPTLVSDDSGKRKWYQPPRRAVRSSDPKNTFTFAFGPAYLSRQQIKSPSGIGTSFDLYDFNRGDDPTTTSAVTLDYDLPDRHSIEVSFWPFESRDQGSFRSPVSFDGAVFPANTNIRSAWLMYDGRAVWNYDIVDDGSWSVDAGIGVAVQYLDITLETTVGPFVSRSVKDVSALPLAQVDASYRFTPKWSANGKVSGFWLSSDWILDATLALRYQFNRQWAADVGYAHYSRDIETSKLANRTDYDAIYMAVAYSF